MSTGAEEPVGLHHRGRERGREASRRGGLASPPLRSFAPTAASDLAGAFADFRAALALPSLWLQLAREELRTRYRRTLIGMAWIGLSFALFISVKMLVFRGMNEVPWRDFFVFITVGYLVWTFVQAMVIDGCHVFVSMERWITGMPVPLSVFVFQSIARNVASFLIAAPIAVAAIALAGRPPSLAWLAVPPALLMLLVTGIGVHYVLGAVCTRNRDVAQIASTGVRVLFFLTPILWMPAQVGDAIGVLRFNPAMHYLDVVRDPLLYGEVRLVSWYVVIGCTLLSVALAVVAFAFARRRLVYWF